MSAHTPGPWKFGKCLSMRSYKWVVAYDTDKGRGVQVALVDSGSANASLIAAAPELLAALIDLADRAEGLESKCLGTVMARAAIAKATGATP